MASFFSESPLRFRKATLEDFDALHRIWMQAHILPFMSFESMSKEAFWPVFKSIFDNSEVFVLEAEGRIVATRRIAFGSGEMAHTAWFCSFGVDQDFQGRGIGTRFYTEFFQLLREKYPHIQRIELGQETDNHSGARHLSEKAGFRECAVFPEWQPRLTGSEEYTQKWMVAERFMELVPDEKIRLSSVPARKFSPCLPVLSVPETPELSMTRSKDGVLCHRDDVLVATCQTEDGYRRFGHIQFWSIKLESGCTKEDAQWFVRHLALEAMTTFKKVEIFASDPVVIDLLEKSGFHYRGIRTAGKYVDGRYEDTTGADFGFFNIVDAHRVLEFSTRPDAQAVKIPLEGCQATIDPAFTSGALDAFGKCYLENMVFQMVREAHAEALYTEDTAPWARLIQDIPDALEAVRKSLDSLANALCAESTHEDTLKMGTP